MPLYNTGNQQLIVLHQKFLSVRRDLVAILAVVLLSRWGTFDELYLMRKVPGETGQFL